MTPTQLITDLQTKLTTITTNGDDPQVRLAAAIELHVIVDRTDKALEQLSRDLKAQITTDLSLLQAKQFKCAAATASITIPKDERISYNAKSLDELAALDPTLRAAIAPFRTATLPNPYLTIRPIKGPANDDN